MQQTSNIKQPYPSHHDEQILVVSRTSIFSVQQPWYGFHATNVDQYLEVIQQNKQFLPRSVMETNPSYKQIIPYLVFEHNTRYFLMQRQSNASESRLKNKFTLGIGGHIRQEDTTTNSISDWAKREFHEEVSYDGTLTIEPLGLVNDDTNLVGQVHIGFVFLLRGSSDKISVKSELKSGRMLSLEECKFMYNHMESWSQFVCDYLATQPPVE